MKKFTITDDRYDNSGLTYEFETEQALIDEMMPTLKTWAQETYEKQENYPDDPDMPTHEEILENMVDELSNCIEEIK